MGYIVHSVTPHWVRLMDTGEGISITNDAENVCKAIYKEYGQRWISYRDTDGRWDELDHKDGVFIGFIFHDLPDSYMPAGRIESAGSS